MVLTACNAWCHQYELNVSICRTERSDISRRHGCLRRGTKQQPCPPGGSDRWNGVQFHRLRDSGQLFTPAPTSTTGTGAAAAIIGTTLAEAAATNAATHSFRTSPNHPAVLCVNVDLQDARDGGSSDFGRHCMRPLSAATSPILSARQHQTTVPTCLERGQGWLPTA